VSDQRSKVLLLNSQSTANGSVVTAIRQTCDVTDVSDIDSAINALRAEHYDAIFSDSADFLPLERAMVSQQASLILNTIGEGVCIVDSEGRCSWMNKKMGAWPAQVHEKIRRTCQEAFELFSKQVQPQTPETPANFSRSKRYFLNIEDSQYMEMIASPVISPSGHVVQVAAVVWDATSTRRLQQKIDAIDKSGRELVRLESDAIVKMNIAERLKLLEDKIISYTRELLHFDHFAIRLLDRKTNKLEVVISKGLPNDALAIELYAEAEGNGISGNVAATGRSYICPDVERDPRYVSGLDSAKSSLTVPLRLEDKVIGVFNVESRQKAAFNEDDRQFAEIFGRYVAIALNILDLLVVERVQIRHQLADDVCMEVAGPLNDIRLEATALMDDFIVNDDLRVRLQQIVDNVDSVNRSLHQAVEGPNMVLGANQVKGEHCPIIRGAKILVADDEPNLRSTIHDVLRKYHADVTLAGNGEQALALIAKIDFDLVLSDIKMPDKTGYDIFDAARKKSATVRVILMTGFGYDPNHSIVRASQEGLSAVLFKPFKVQQLLSEVRKALQPVPIQT
jgi:two-component system, sensor histidine kinase SagS